MRGVGRFGEVLWLAAAVGCVAATAVALGAQEGAPAAGVPRPTGGAGAPAAQERNLQILPKDISRQELGEIMQGFARSLGVGCDHCHTGESMETMDWGNDDKDTKKNAREIDAPGPHNQRWPHRPDEDGPPARTGRLRNLPPRARGAAASPRRHPRG